MKNTEVFTEKAHLYSKYRPTYSDKLIQYLYVNVGIKNNSYIADIGSGTGMFSILLLKQGSNVFAIEPNDSMRSIAEMDFSQYNNFRSIKATGENTHLPQNSIDFITVAQAFHWLDAELFKAECKRIMKKNGKVIVIYNRKTKEAEINLKLADLIKRQYPDYNDIINHWELRENVIIDFFNNKYEFISFENNIINTLNEFIGRTISASYAKSEKLFINELQDFFYCFAKDSLITVPNDTIAYIGEI